eukprot:TRINITY_DN2851_c0_g1_i2.p1 TRINITY_DN2851_c0_g1~~TRINITY_DN2851_c0_g1_i2.p1  ORF type:complete len:120 (-),score=25.30 TRINITY_DN2851_c0_g1_i2:130-489(-)
MTYSVLILLIISLGIARTQEDEGIVVSGSDNAVAKRELILFVLSAAFALVFVFAYYYFMARKNSAVQNSSPTIVPSINKSARQYRQVDSTAHNFTQSLPSDDIWAINTTSAVEDEDEKL